MGREGVIESGKISGSLILWEEGLMTHMIPREAVLERRDGDVCKYLKAELQQSNKI